MKVFKPFIATVLALSLAVASVVCCCLAAGVMAHVHKSVTSCCAKKSPSHQNSSNPTGTCLNHLTNAELGTAQTVLSAPAAVVFVPTLSMGTYHAQSLAAFPQVYSRGSPPLPTTVPIYLQIRSLRI